MVHKKKVLIRRIRHLALKVSRFCQQEFFNLFPFSVSLFDLVAFPALDVFVAVVDRVVLVVVGVAVAVVDRVVLAVVGVSVVVVDVGRDEFVVVVVVCQRLLTRKPICPSHFKRFLMTNDAIELS